MNKKIIILSVVLLVIIGGAGFLYMDSLISLFTGDNNKEANLTPQQPAKAPAEQMQPVGVFEKSFEKIYNPLMKSFGLEGINSVDSIKFLFKFNIEFNEEFIKQMPKPLQKIKNADFSFGLTADKSNNNYALTVESAITKKVNIAFLNNTGVFCVPDLKEIYTLSVEDISKMLPFPIPSLNLENKTTSSEADSAEKKSDETEDDETEDAKKENESKPESQPKSDQPVSDDEASKKTDKSKKLLDDIKNNYDISREKGDNKSVKIILKPKKIIEFAPESLILFVNKKSFAIEKIEAASKDVITKEPKNSIAVLEYDASGNITKLSVSETQKSGEPKKSSLSLAYKDGLVESLQIEAENVSEQLNLTYNEEKKLESINFEKDIQGIGKLSLNITDILINSELEENDFVIEGTEKFKKKSSEDFNKEINSGKLAKRIWKLDEKALKQAGNIIMSNLMTAFMSSAKLTVADASAVQENKKETKTDVKNNKSDDDEDLDEDEEKPVSKTKPDLEDKKKAVQNKKAEPKKTAKNIKDDSEDEDSEDGEVEEKPVKKESIKPAKKNKSSKPEKKSKFSKNKDNQDEESEEQTSVAEEKKEKPVSHPKREPVADEPDVSGREYSAQYLEIVKLYNSGKTDKIQLLPRIEEILKAEPTNAEALYLAAIINFQNIKNNDEALRYFDLVLKHANLNNKIDRQIYYWSRMLKKQIIK
ncbi:hypothetical protein KA977_02295 [Candidatus Dependentiae bacterium]|nr:hypothetical protein [Candidatus Dependentiae bacterium]